MDAKNAILAARKVIELYKADNGGSVVRPIPVMPARDMSSDKAVPASGIAVTVAKMVDLPIGIERIGGDLGVAMTGYMLRYTDRVVIGYSSKLNLCWSRFVMCKELAHVFLGKEDNYTSTSERAVQLLVELFNDTPLNQSSDFLVENEAVFAATELLLPKELVPEIREMKELKCSNLEIAHSFRVPTKIVAFRFDLPTIAEIFED